jgi:hypothetical protein
VFTSRTTTGRPYDHAGFSDVTKASRREQGVSRATAEREANDYDVSIEDKLENRAEGERSPHAAEQVSG